MGQFTLDFSGANEALQAMMRTFMQDWVGRRNDARSMEYLKESGEVWEEKAKNDAAREIARMNQQYDLGKAGATRAWIDEVSMLPQGRAIIANLQKKQMLGEDITSQLFELDRLYKATGPGMEDMTTNYNTTAPNIASAFAWLDNPQETITQAMRNRQAGKELDFKWEELAYLKDKEGGEQSDKATTRYLTKLNELRSHLSKIRAGEPVLQRDPDTGIIKQTTAQMEAEQARNLDRQLATLADIETRILKHDIRENDFGWIDDHWNQSQQDIIMTKAFNAQAEGKYKTLNEAIEQETYNTLKSIGDYEAREAGVGAPVEDALYRATGGKYSFHPETAIPVKKKLFDAFMTIRKDTMVGDQAMVDDEMIFEMLAREFPFLQDLVVRGGAPLDEEETTQTVKEATKGTENQSTSKKTTSASAKLREE